MAIIHFINRPKSQTKAGMLFTIRYVMRDDKTVFNGKKLVTGINCTPSCAYTQFNNTKLLYGKNDGRQYYHFVQSFPKDEYVSPELAHEIALRFIYETEKFKGFEVIAATHCDRDHTHTHFVMNSVNTENGLKFHIEQGEIEMLMKASDGIIAEYGLSICVADTEKKKKHISDREYRAMDKRQGWKLELAMVIDSCMDLAKSKRHFKWLMEQEGYKVKWTDERKNITYTCPNAKKCCDDKLHDDKYLKENMEYEFRIRQEIFRGLQTRSGCSDENGGEGRTGHICDRAELQSSDCTYGYAESMAGVPVTDTQHTDDGRRYARGTVSSNDGADKSISESTDRYAEYFRINENGEREYLITGWENERDGLVVSQRTAGADDKIYEAALVDFGGGKLDMLIDGAYLAADISNMIDDDGEVIDCTTRYYGRRKKQPQDCGPVMSGM